MTPLERHVGIACQVAHLVELCHALAQGWRQRRGHCYGELPNANGRDAHAAMVHDELQSGELSRVGCQQLRSAWNPREDWDLVPLGGREQGVVLAALQTCHLTRLGHRNDPHAQRTGFRTHLRHNSLQLRITSINSHVIHEAIGMQLHRAFRKGIRRADSAIWQLLTRGQHLRTEPVRFADQHSVDADRIHRLDSSSDHRVEGRCPPVRYELVQVNLCVNDLHGSPTTLQRGQPSADSSPPHCFNMCCRSMTYGAVIMMAVATAERGANIEI